MNENKNLIDKLKNIFEIKQDIKTPEGHLNINVSDPCVTVYYLLCIRIEKTFKNI